MVPEATERDSMVSPCNLIEYRRHLSVIWLRTHTFINLLGRSWLAINQVKEGNIYKGPCDLIRAIREQVATFHKATELSLSPTTSSCCSSLSKKHVSSTQWSKGGKAWTKSRWYPCSVFEFGVEEVSRKSLRVLSPKMEMEKEERTSFSCVIPWTLMPLNTWKDEHRFPDLRSYSSKSDPIPARRRGKGEEGRRESAEISPT